MSGAELEQKARKAQAVGASVKIVGAWVWAEFESKPSEETRAMLKAERYHWNRKRGVWQFAGVPCRHSPASTPEVLAKYGAVDVETEQN